MNLHTSYGIAYAKYSLLMQGRNYKVEGRTGNILNSIFLFFFDILVLLNIRILNKNNNMLTNSRVDVWKSILTQDDHNRPRPEITLRTTLKS